ncbi:MAG: hypothetical protein V7K83_25800 [Nostoc sp.]
MLTLPGRVGGVKAPTNHKKAIDSVELWKSRLVEFGINKPPILNQYFSTRGCTSLRDAARTARWHSEPFGKLRVRPVELLSDHANGRAT